MGYFLQKRGLEQYFVGFMQGMMDNTQSTSTCLTSGLQLDTILGTVENTLVDVYQNKNINIATIINSLNTSINNWNSIQSDCQINTLQENISQSISTSSVEDYIKRICYKFGVFFKYTMILHTGVMTGNKQFVGEAIGVYFKLLFNVVRSP
ncbi:UNKNOWN [Stylonychia lemnae]|uniref:Uncharacterized protein n=1 Tax=Stylonychia lemnae TaxID=5949 RepID=A0A078B5Z5_STYLE|nr:UNKNOWN [Stylonychia lemnae]|eukprot:CDW89930.1 UNKNOWN [Stylonychia lemnae]